MPLTWSITTDVWKDSQGGVAKDFLTGERAIRSHRAVASDDTGTDLLAIAAVEAIAGVTHPSLSGVPYAYCAFKKIGVRQWLIEQNFGWGPDISWGGASASTSLRGSLGKDFVEVYTFGTLQSDGLPENMNGVTPASTTSPLVTKWWDCPFPLDANGPRPRSILLSQACLQLRVPFRLNTLPLTAAMVACVDRLNDDTVTFLAGVSGGIAFAAGQVRFDGEELDWRDNSSYRYVGEYVFTCKYSFKMQRPYIDSSGSGNWATEKGVLYPLADFNTAFNI